MPPPNASGSTARSHSVAAQVAMVCPKRLRRAGTTGGEYRVQGDALIGISDAKVRRRAVKCAAEAALAAIATKNAVDVVRECQDRRPTA